MSKSWLNDPELEERLKRSMNNLDELFNEKPRFVPIRPMPTERHWEISWLARCYRRLVD